MAVLGANYSFDQGFSETVNRTKPVVLSMIRRFLHPENTDHIDDVAQETYLKAYKALRKNQFRGDAKISTWLAQIAKNEALALNQKLAHEKKKQKKIINQNQESIRFKKAAGSNQPIFFPQETAEVRSLHWKRNHTLLSNALGLLPKKYHEVLILYLEGYKTTQIGNLLSLPVGTVKSRFFRGKEFLKRWLSSNT